MLCVRMQNTRNKPPYAIHGEDMKNGRNTTNEQDASEYWLSVQAWCRDGGVLRERRLGAFGKEVATFLHAVRRVSRNKAVCSTALRSFSVYFILFYAKFAACELMAAVVGGSDDLHLIHLLMSDSLDECHKCSLLK
ncbi:hypothetical protein T06_16264 [Trichinella sp. T6]|nr:hypothetical protein T06_16264 [Trichinella sp. T6]